MISNFLIFHGFYNYLHSAAFVKKVAIKNGRSKISSTRKIFFFLSIR